ncbi:Acyl dehydratase [hydrothermal vent metagenome]|jgi:acyl dehydratase|uniref:Acyl dehydratase n=1 Tax=hydrothermal vent metagenome TaxID=652676 RepID=A0A3B0SM04_9ZZZZ
MSLIDELEDLVGTEYGVSDWVVIEQSRVQQFADATEDHQWIHVDPDRAAEGPFGGTIAHGYLTLSLLPRYAPTPKIAGVRMGINYGLDRVRFITPIPVGGRIRFRTTILEVTEFPGGAQLKLNVTVELEGAERPACVVQSLVRLYE